MSQLEYESLKVHQGCGIWLKSVRVCGLKNQLKGAGGDRIGTAKAGCIPALRGFAVFCRSAGNARGCNAYEGVDYEF
jgi:hypothetical protein